MFNLFKLSFCRNRVKIQNEELCNKSLETVENLESINISLNTMSTRGKNSAVNFRNQIVEVKTKFLSFELNTFSIL